MMLLKSKQHKKFIKLRNHLEQRGCSIAETIADIGNDIIRWGDFPGNILVTWELKRANYIPVYIDFEANDNGMGIVISKDDFWRCSIRGTKFDYCTDNQCDENLTDLLKTLDKIVAEQGTSH